MLKYSDGTPINVGDKVRFKFCGLADTGTVHEVYADGVDVKLTTQHDGCGNKLGWTHPIEGFQAWFVPDYELVRIDEVKYPTPAFTQLKGRPDDPYSAGPEGETAGYIARHGGLKYL